MFATCIVVLREVLEAALIVGIVTAASRGIPGYRRWIAGGITLGLLGAGIVAIFAATIASAVSGTGQEIFNAIVLFAAVLLLGWHNVWMARHARSLSLEAADIGAAVSQGARPLSALAIVTGLAVLREGSETVLFLTGIATEARSPLAMAAGGAMGLVAGIAAGVALYAGLLRIPVRHFFTVTGWIVLFVAAGLAAQGASFLVQIDVLPSLGDAVWDSSALLSDHSIAGRILHALIGYVARPSGIELVFYLGAILVIGSLMLLVRTPKAATASRLGRVSAVIPVVAAVGLMFSPQAHAGDKVYSPIVEEGEWELETRLLFSHDRDPSLNGAANHVFEIGYAPTSYWATSVLLEYERDPGKTGQATHFAWENIFQLTPQGKYWLDVGAYVELEKGLNGHPDEIETKMLLEKEFYNWVTTANVIFKKNISGNEGRAVEFGYDWRVKYTFSPKFELGVEGYSQLGELRNLSPSSEQYHTIGPAILGRLPLGPGHIRYDVAYLRGLTSATQASSFQINLEYELRF